MSPSRNSIGIIISFLIIYIFLFIDGVTLFTMNFLNKEEFRSLNSVQFYSVSPSRNSIGIVIPFLNIPIFLFIDGVTLCTLNFLNIQFSSILLSPSRNTIGIINSIRNISFLMKSVSTN